MRLNPLKIPRLDVPPKVVGDPTREPVNKQAAMIVTPAAWWAKPLPPEAEPARNYLRMKAELDRVQSQLKQAEQRSGKLSAKYAASKKETELLRSTIKNCEGTISTLMTQLNEIKAECAELQARLLKLNNWKL